MIHLLWASLAIPIIVHLVYRRKAKPMPFSTLYFLRLIDQRITRRERLKELLLLALRLLLLAALIGALEKRVLPTSALSGRSVPTCAAIVLDNTCSMRADEQDGSAFGRARAAALVVLDGLEGEDTAVIVPLDSSDDEAAEPSSARGDLRKDLESMPCGYAAARLSGALRQALDGLKQSTQRRKEVYVITDMQRLCWTPDLSSLTDSIPDDVPVFLVDVGADVARNLSLEDVNLGLKVTVRGALTNIYCSVRNTGQASATRKLSLVIDDKRLDEQDVTLAAGSTTVAVMGHIFERVGVHSGYVELDTDGLEADNRRYFTVRVRERLPVLVVNGAPSVIPYRDGAFYLRLALHATTRRGESLSPVQAEIVPEDQLPAHPLGDYGCVILADVAEIEPSWADRLARYVRGGGGLLIFCGSRVNAESYNATLGPDGAGILPARLAAPVSAQAGDDPFFRIVNVNVQHPIFRDIFTEMNWDTTQFKRFFRTESENEDDEAGVLLSLSEGPLLVEQSVGPGTVMLCTSTCTAEWNNMPLKKSFLPLLHQIVYYMSRSASESVSTPVGMAYRLKIPDVATSVPVKFFPPRGEDTPREDKERQPQVVQSVVENGVNTATFHGVDVPGVYRTEVHAGDKVLRGMFAVNVLPAESNLERIPAHEAAAMLDADKVDIVADAGQLDAVVKRQREGLPLWDYLLAATLVIAVIESLVANVALKH